MMSKVAILFAGQGAQYVGMGKEFYDKYQFVRDIYAKANQHLGYKLEDICFVDNTKLDETIYTQTAILTTSIATYTAFLRDTGLKPDALAGFSLGEYSALYASKVFDLDSIIQLVKYRAESMQQCAIENKGTMAAIIGMDRDRLESLCMEECHGNDLVQVANYNCSSQYVVGGTLSAVNTLCQKAIEQGAKRAIELKVSGAFHTPLMKCASDKMKEYLTNFRPNQPQIPIVMNYNAKYLDTDVATLMTRQIESSVYFEDSIKRLIDDGIDTFVEIGPGSVLSGLVRKIDRNAKVYHINKISDIELIKGELAI